MSSIFYRIQQNIYMKTGRLFNKKINRIDNMPTLISSNCIGGVVYHNAGKQFTSPTINMYIKPKDFLLLVNSIEECMSYQPRYNEGESKLCGFPVMSIECSSGIVNLYCLHYSSFEDACAIWEKRKNRINYQNILVIMTDRDGFTEDDLKSFENLKYPKVLYTCKNYSGYNNIVFVKAFRKENQVGTMTDYCDVFGNRYFEKYFDIYKYCNGNTFESCLL